MAGGATSQNTAMSTELLSAIRGRLDLICALGERITG